LKPSFYYRIKVHLHYAFAVMKCEYCSVPDPEVWDRIRIRILALINDPISTFLVFVCKSHKYFRNLCCITFWFMNVLFTAYFRSKISRRNLDEILLGPGQDPDVFKSRIIRIRIESKIVQICNSGFLRGCLHVIVTWRHWIHVFFYN
jgi:hypothetical protein